MKEIKPDDPDIDDEWYAVTDPKKGQMRCSCGNSLIKVDENTYRCGSMAGFPLYRFDMGEFFIDKFGELCFKKKAHEGEGDDAGD